MSQVLHRFQIRFYNFASVLCLKKEKQDFEVSNIAAFINLLKMPFVLILTTVAYVFFSEEFVPDKFVGMKQFSTFSKVSITISASSSSITSYVFAISQVLRRHEMCKFVNFWIKKPLEQGNLQRYQSDCKKHHVSFLIVFTSLLVFQYLGAAKFSIFSLLTSVVFMYPNYLLFAVLSFVTSFQNFVIAQLNEFYEELIKFSRYSKQTTTTAVESYQEISRNYQQIYEFVEQFKKIFGVQLTLIICTWAFSLVFTVKSNRILLLVLTIFSFSFITAFALR